MFGHLSRKQRAQRLATFQSSRYFRRLVEDVGDPNQILFQADKKPAPSRRRLKPLRQKLLSSEMNSVFLLGSIPLSATTHRSRGRFGSKTF